MALNACELEIDLFCRGMRVPDGVSLAGARGASRPHAFVASGLELAIQSPSRIKHEVGVSVPIAETVTKQSPYQLAGSPEAGYTIVDDRTHVTTPVRLPPQPEWYTRETSRGEPMDRIGVLRGTYLVVDANPARGAKSIDDVVETCWAAKNESAVTFVDLLGGFRGPDGLDFIMPYVKAIKDRVGLLVGVQLQPSRDFARYGALASLGVDHLAFCLKSQDLDLDALQYCVALMPGGAVTGEIVAGLEPIACTIEAIDRIAARGAFPEVRIFRPLAGSALEEWPAPRYEDMRRVMAHLYEVCRAHWMPVGVAPNVEASLVVTPDDAALLAERTPAFYIYEAYRRMTHVAASPVFWQRMRPVA